MAQLPRFSQRTSTPLRGVGGGLDRPALGPSLGEGLQSLGMGARALGADIQQRDEAEERQRAAEEEARQREAKDEATRRSGPDATQAVIDIERERQRLEGELPDGQGLQAALDARINEIYGGYIDANKGDPYYADIMSRERDDKRRSFGTSALATESRARLALREGTAGDIVNRATGVFASDQLASVDAVDRYEETALAQLRRAADLIEDPVKRIEVLRDGAHRIAEARYERLALLTGALPETGSIYAAIERQESSGNPNAVSNKGALGLMQLMPDTARYMARKLGIADVAGMNDADLRRRLLKDTALNRKLGAAYFDEQMEKYDAVSLALAAYNAGPQRVDEWLGRFGDPRKGDISMEDFVRSIPFQETRDYVRKIGRNLGDSALVRPEARARTAAKLEKIKQEERDQLVNQLDLAISRGEAGHAEIDRAVRDGVLDPADATYVRLVKDADAVVEKAQAERAAVARVDAAGRGGALLDPKSQDDMKALDRHYGLQAQAWGQLAPDEFARRSAQYAKLKGAVPPSMRAWVRGSLRSADPNTVAAGADLVQLIRNANPELLNDFAEEDIRLAVEINGLTQLGMSIPEARKQIDAEGSMTDEQRAYRDRSLAEITKGDPSERFLRKKVEEEFAPGLFDANPLGARNLMIADYDALVQRAYRRTGNLDIARQSAWDQLRRSWGRTEIGGRRMMRYAPEASYRMFDDPKQNTRWISEQLDEQLPKGLTAKDVVLVQHPAQPFDQQGNPVYAVVSRKDGRMTPIMDDDGGVLAWQPVWRESPEAKRRGPAQAAAVEKAEGSWHDRFLREREAARRSRVRQPGEM